MEYCVGVPPHRALLATTEQGCGMAELDHPQHGMEHDEGEADAGGIMGRGDVHGGVHPQPRVDPVKAWRLLRHGTKRSLTPHS